MKKIRKVLEFILALLNFLFHFKPVPDETPPISPESFPLPDYQDLEKRNEPLFETICQGQALVKRKKPVCERQTGFFYLFVE